MNGLGIEMQCLRKQEERCKRIMHGYYEWDSWWITKEIKRVEKERNCNRNAY